MAQPSPDEIIAGRITQLLSEIAVATGAANIAYNTWHQAYFGNDPRAGELQQESIRATDHLRRLKTELRTLQA